MYFKRTARSFTAWIALLAVLLGALAPALSHALSRADGEKRLIQVCTVAGMKMVAVDDSRDKGDAHVFPAERCAFCATHCDVPALPAMPSAPFALKARSDHLPPLYLHSPRPLFAWAAAQPRAPPLPRA